MPTRIRGNSCVWGRDPSTRKNTRQTQTSSAGVSTIATGVPKTILPCEGLGHGVGHVGIATIRQEIKCHKESTGRIFK